MITVRYSSSLNLPYYKDWWGYKNADPVQGVQYGSIIAKVCACNERNLEKDLEGNRRTLELLKGEEVQIPVTVSLGGIVTPDVFNTPGAVKLHFAGVDIPMSIRLLRYGDYTVRNCSRRNFFSSGYAGEALCRIKLEREYPELNIQEHDMYPVSGLAYSPSALRLWLSQPDEYYVSDIGNFITLKPKTFDDLAKIYGREKGKDSPSAESIMLAPTDYVENREPAVAKFVHALLSGSLDGYR